MVDASWDCQGYLPLRTRALPCPWRVRRRQGWLLKEGWPRGGDGLHFRGCIAWNQLHGQDKQRCSFWCCALNKPCGECLSAQNAALEHPTFRPLYIPAAAWLVLVAVEKYFSSKGRIHFTKCQRLESVSRMAMVN